MALWGSGILLWDGDVASCINLGVATTVLAMVVVVGQEEMYCCQGGIAIIHYAYVSLILPLSSYILIDLGMTRVASRESAAQEVGEK